MPMSAQKTARGAVVRRTYERGGRAGVAGLGGGGGLGALDGVNTTVCDGRCCCSCCCCRLPPNVRSTGNNDSSAAAAAILLQQQQSTRALSTRAKRRHTSAVQFPRALCVVVRAISYFGMFVLCENVARGAAAAAVCGAIGVECRVCGAVYKQDEEEKREFWINIFRDKRSDRTRPVV
jgi:hypothetical protein